MFKQILLFVCLSLSTVAVAQNYTFGKVSMEELSAQQDADFPDADAVILYKEVISRIGREREVWERIKIFNEDGFDYSSVRIPYTKPYKLKAYTYNLVDGEIVKTKLDKDLIFTDEEVEGVKIKKFTFPKVSPGSVIELTYKTNSGTLADVDLQYDIPVKKIKVEASNYSGAKFKIVQNPRAYVNAARVDKAETTVISAENIPALERENYVYSMDLFTAKLQFVLSGFFNSIQLDTWENIAEALYDDEDFVGPMKPRGFYEKSLDSLLADVPDPMDRIEKVYDYVRSHVTWDESFGYYPSNESSRKTYNDREGDVTDINMLLISMLRSIDVQAYPMLVSTRGNGVPITPTPEAFNYLVAAVIHNDTYYYLDAANDRATFDFLPKMLLNWNGMVMKDARTVKPQDLTTPKISNKMIIANATIDEDLYVMGDAREKDTGYYAIGMESYLEDSSDQRKEQLIEFDHEGVEVTNIKVGNQDDGRDAIQVSYEFELEDGIDEIGDKLYFSPLMFLGMKENPFTKDTRRFPIDFGFPRRNQYTLNVKIPEGYQVESLPDPLKIVLPDNVGSFTYRIIQQGGMLQVQSKYQINQTVVAFDKYHDLKEFFKVRMNKESEKVVLSKI